MPADESGGSVSQADIDAALAEAGMSQAGEPARAAASDEPMAAVETQVDSAEQLLDSADAAMAGVTMIGGDSRTKTAEVTPFELPRMEKVSGGEALPEQGIDLLRDVQLHVKIELGRNRMLVDDVLRLGPGCVVELDKLAGDPVDVFVNDRLIARGEVLVLNDNFCVRINDIMQQGMEDETN